MNPPWRYRILVRLLTPLLIGYTVWRAVKDGGIRYLSERLGIYSKPFTRPNLWIHAASVGEVFTVLPLLRKWLIKNPQARVVFTTGTPTGALVLQQQGLQQVQHRYLPVDFPGACRRFVRQLDAATGWIVETEIWPWLYAQCHRNNTALILINGRLSARTSNQAIGLLASSYRRALRDVTVLARSKTDHDNFVRLGADPDKVQTVGNLKYTASADPDNYSPLLPVPYVLAASTHDNEEQQIARAWHAGKTEHSLLVIVPRHPERGVRIMQQLTELGLQVSQRSLSQSPAPEHSVYLADTLGEMQAWYAHARAAFVGGSLIARGGHNVLEPARYACPTVVGPHTSNFDDIVEVMHTDNALTVAQNADEVVEFLSKGAQQEPSVTAMGKRAQLIADKSRQVLTTYSKLLVD